jgi:hypothetical protein
MKLTTAIQLIISAASSSAELPAEIPLWPNAAPGSEGKTATEVVVKSASGEISVSSIHNPSLTPYLPAKEKAVGTAMLVIPGGGHRVLAITHEGYNVAEWLSEHGIAAFVLKHRLAREPSSTYKIEVESLADTKRAMRLIRSRAAEWGIDPATRRRNWILGGWRTGQPGLRALRRRAGRRERSHRTPAVPPEFSGADLPGPLGRHPADGRISIRLPRVFAHRPQRHLRGIG